MKKIKSLLLVAVLSFTLFTASAFAKDKVKVYVFEAGGCPYCEAELEYLKGLESYDKKFEIIRKELYVDHVEWEEGSDYDLGVKVANAFLNKGYNQASYQGTPFVVISNIYAAASYSESLESIINDAYDAGDKDIVGCFEDGKDDCADKIQKNEGATTAQPSEDPTATDNTENNGNSVTAVIVLVAIVAGIVVLLVVAHGKNKGEIIVESKKDTKKPEVEEEPIVEEVKKVETKPATKKPATKKPATKKTAAKKTTTKKPAAKKTTTKKPVAKKTTAKKTTKK